MAGHGEKPPKALTLRYIRMGGLYHGATAPGGHDAPGGRCRVILPVADHIAGDRVADVIGSECELVYPNQQLVVVQRRALASLSARLPDVFALYLEFLNDGHGLLSERTKRDTRIHVRSTQPHGGVLLVCCRFRQGEGEILIPGGGAQLAAAGRDHNVLPTVDGVGGGGGVGRPPVTGTPRAAGRLACRRYAASRRRWRQ